MTDGNFRAVKSLVRAPLETIIVGTGRCGTTYVAKLLTLAGYPCTHEAFFNDEGLDAAMRRFRGETHTACSATSTRDDSSWAPLPASARAEASYLAAPFLSHPILFGAKIVHLLRHPLLVVSSLVEDLGFFHEVRVDQVSGWERLILSTLPHVAEHPSPVLRAADYYVRWNRMIEAQCVGRDCLRHRIEDGGESILRFLSIATAGSARPGNKVNTYRRSAKAYSWRELPNHPVIDALREYGHALGYDNDIPLRIPPML